MFLRYVKHCAILFLLSEINFISLKMKIISSTERLKKIIACVINGKSKSSGEYICPAIKNAGQLRSTNSLNVRQIYRQCSHLTLQHFLIAIRCGTACTCEMSITISISCSRITVTSQFDCISFLKTKSNKKINSSTKWCLLMGKKQSFISHASFYLIDLVQYSDYKMAMAEALT